MQGNISKTEASQCALQINKHKNMNNNSFNDEIKVKIKGHNKLMKIKYNKNNHIIKL